MKNYLWLTFLFLILPFIGIAQDFDYEISRPFRVVDAEIKEYFYKDGKIMAVKIDNKLITIQTWDVNSMKELIRNEYKDLPKDYVFEGLKEFNKKYYFFYSEWDGRNDDEQLFVRKIDFENGKFLGEGERLFKVSGKVTDAITDSGFNWLTWSPWKTKVTKKFNFVQSFDESRILIQYRKKPESRNDDKSHDRIGFNVYDDEMNEISREEIKMPYTESKMDNLDYSIDSKGNMYVLALVYKDDSQKLKNKSGNVNYNIEVLRININSKDLNKTKIKVGNVYLNKVRLFSQADDQMVCAGFYTKKLQTFFDNSDGVIMFKVGVDGEASEVRTYEIPLEVLNMYSSNKSKNYNKKKDKKGKAEFAELEMRDIIIDQDGSVVLIGEQYYINVNSSIKSSSRC